MMRLLLPCMLLLLLLAACGQDSGTQAQPEAVKADAPTLYKNYCLSCHGNNLQGLQGPNLQQVGARLSEEQIVEKIQKGGDGMPGLKVSIREEDIQTLASWLAAKK